MKLIDKLKQYIPVPKKRVDMLEGVHKKQIQDLKEEQANTLIRLNAMHEKELAKYDKTVDEITERLANIRFDLPNPETLRYRMCLDFDARLMNYGSSPQVELNYIAQSVARHVEAEIRSARFIRRGSV